MIVTGLPEPQHTKKGELTLLLLGLREHEKEDSWVSLDFDSRLGIQANLSSNAFSLSKVYRG